MPFSRATAARARRRRVPIPRRWCSSITVTAASATSGASGDPDVAGHADPRLSGLVGRTATQGEVIHVVDLGEPPERLRGELCQGEEPSVARLRGEPSEALDQGLLVLGHHRAGEDPGPVPQRDDRGPATMKPPPIVAGPRRPIGERMSSPTAGRRVPGARRLLGSSVVGLLPGNVDRSHLPLRCCATPRANDRILKGFRYRSSHDREFSLVLYDRRRPPWADLCPRPSPRRDLRARRFHPTARLRPRLDGRSSSCAPRGLTAPRCGAGLTTRLPRKQRGGPMSHADRQAPHKVDAAQTNASRWSARS